MLNATVQRLCLKGITKRYPSVVANDHVDLHIASGEIHALLGENGAGKSTLMKIAYGVTQPEAGEIYWNGERVHIKNPADARALGIGMVFQHFSLFESLTVAENIELGQQKSGGRKQLSRRIIEVSEQYGLRLDPDALVHDLSVGERQRVEIVRCLLQAPKLLIMDEPTSVLTPSAVQKLFKTLRQLAKEGCSILYISHKLDEIRELCSIATVMREGKVTRSQIVPSTHTHKELAHMMIGDQEISTLRSDKLSGTNVKLAINALSRSLGTGDLNALSDINLCVNAGEIVGIAGISGNGQQALLRAISGEEPSLSNPNEVVVNAEPCGLYPPAKRRQHGLGMGFVPEERLGRGVVPELALDLNALLTGHPKLRSKYGFIDYGAVEQFAKNCIDQYQVACGGTGAVAQSLSGGNLQKFILGREILLAPEVLVLAQPTWGVDIGAATLIRQTLIQLRDKGVAILVVSEELDELYEISDRITVIAKGRLSPVVPLDQVDKEQIGVWMSGLFDADKQMSDDV